MSYKEVLQFILSNYPELIAAFLSAYEFLVRIYPTVKNYSILSKIIKILQWIDQKLNNKKK